MDIKKDCQDRYLAVGGTVENIYLFLHPATAENDIDAALEEAEEELKEIESGEVDWQEEQEEENFSFEFLTRLRQDKAFAVSIYAFFEIEYNNRAELSAALLDYEAEETPPPPPPPVPSEAELLAQAIAKTTSLYNQNWLNLIKLQGVDFAEAYLLLSRNSASKEIITLESQADFLGVEYTEEVLDAILIENLTDSAAAYFGA